MGTFEVYYGLSSPDGNSPRFLSVCVLGCLYGRPFKKVAKGSRLDGVLTLLFGHPVY